MRNTNLTITYEHDPKPEAEDRLLEIFEFLLHDDKARLGHDRNDHTETTHR